MENLGEGQRKFYKDSKLYLATWDVLSLFRLEAMNQL
jgi:hypothetical protein